MGTRVQGSRTRSEAGKRGRAAANRLATPGRAFASCTTIGSWRDGPPDKPAAPRIRQSRRHVGGRPDQHVPGAAPRSFTRPGMRKSSEVTWRGNGTGGISSRG